jgi:hypothetical protein
MYNRIRNPMNRMRSLLLVALLVSAAFLCGFQSRSTQEPAVQKPRESSGPTTEMAGKGQFDGPAELPRSTVDVRMPQQTKKVVTVHANDNLQALLEKASCGDTVQLEAGATFGGTFRFPNKACDDAHWIVVRTSAPDSSLPPEGKRLTPCFAGVSSLPGRPDLDCKSTKVVTARLEANSSDGAIIFAPGANHYRFVGLEITRAPARPKLSIVYTLMANGQQAPADHIIFDRVWAHGNAQDETNHGFRTNGITYAAVINSTFTDFHCVARTGACTDAQAIVGGNGKLPSGPFLIENNFLEASGECILLGGGPGTVTPTDITIRRNHLFKPLIWHRGEQGFVGGADGQPFIVKNLFELKVGTRVLFEANVLQYSWGGFTQAGFAILLTPRNQADRPSTQITDVTIRHCIIQHTGSGMQIANPAGDVASAVAGERYSIHDLIFDDIDERHFEGHGNLAQIGMGQKPDVPKLQHVSLEHITAFPKHVLLALGGPSPAQIEDVRFANNLVSAGQYGINPAGSPCNHGVGRDPISLIESCWKSYEFKNNVIIGGGGGWPPGNFQAKNLDAVDLEKTQWHEGMVYRLAARSRYKAKGTDGKDVGADLDAIEQAVQGVY